MIKRIISILVLVMYLHSMSGYTMSFHKCNITGFEKVYTSFAKLDPCAEMDYDCNATTTHFERGKCCDVQYTLISIDDDSNISSCKTSLSLSYFGYRSIICSVHIFEPNRSFTLYDGSFFKRPPEPSILSTFRI